MISGGGSSATEEPATHPEDARQALERFACEHTLAETELIFGVVGPLGTNIDKIVERLHVRLEAFEYAATEIRLSGLLHELDWNMRLANKSKLDTYISTHMDAGNRLRSEWERGDSLALLGIARILDSRDSRYDGQSQDIRHAWILRQLKTPDEVETLRNVYGSRFLLIGAYAPEDERAQSLDKAIASSRRSENRSNWEFTTEELLQRDQADREPFGQDVRDTFHRADLFVDASKDAELDSQIERLLEIIFANPFRSPTDMSCRLSSGRV